MIFVSGLIESGISPLSESKGILFGIGAAIFYATVVIMNKKLPGIDAYEKTIIQWKCHETIFMIQLIHDYLFGVWILEAHCGIVIAYR